MRLGSSSSPSMNFPFQASRLTLSVEWNMLFLPHLLEMLGLYHSGVEAEGEKEG